MMVKKHWHTSQSNLDFASELARLFSTQLELSDLDYQKPVSYTHLIMGMATDDSRIRRAPELAREQGLEVSITTGEIDGAHPNTCLLYTSVLDWMKLPPIIWVTMKKAHSTASQGACSPFLI